MAKDPASIATKWSQNLSAAAGNGTIQSGIQGVTVAPGQAAARQKQVWATNTAAAVDRWATATAAVPLSSWQDAAVNKGLQRIATGATAAEPKFTTFMTKLMPVINSAKANLPARGNFQQNLTRATQMATALHNAKGSFK